MENSWTRSQPWFGDLKHGEDGIWTIKDGRCAVGIVLLTRYRDKVVLVRKAQVTGYEFSGRLTLPGGIVRGPAGATFDDCAENSIALRASRECGVDPDLLEDLRLDETGNPPVTSYTAKGSRRYTLVLAAHVTLRDAFAPKSNDQTVSEAFLTDMPLSWEEFAPANRLILAKTLSNDISEKEKAACTGQIDQALSFCNDAAATLGLPLFEHPWRS
jgi:hypothetical protein